jgi:hypothetical protein
MSDKIAAMVGANDFHIDPRKGEYIILSKRQVRVQCLCAVLVLRYFSFMIFPTFTLHGRGAPFTLTNSLIHQVSY